MAVGTIRKVRGQSQSQAQSGGGSSGRTWSRGGGQSGGGQSSGQAQGNGGHWNHDRSSRGGSQTSQGQGQVQAQTQGSVQSGGSGTWTRGSHNNGGSSGGTWNRSNSGRSSGGGSGTWKPRRQPEQWRRLHSLRTRNVERAATAATGIAKAATTVSAVATDAETRNYQSRAETYLGSHGYRDYSYRRSHGDVYYYWGYDHSGRRLIFRINALTGLLIGADLWGSGVLDRYGVVESLAQRRLLRHLRRRLLRRLLRKPAARAMTAARWSSTSTPTMATCSTSVEATKRRWPQG